MTTGAAARRAVVVGPYPPTADPRGDAVLATVRRLRAEGFRVDVVSPQPSAAGFRVSPDRWFGATRLGRVTRGADLVVVHAGPARRGVCARGAARAFAASVARARRVEWDELPAPTPDPRSLRRRTGGEVARWRAGLRPLVWTLTMEARAKLRR